MEDFSEKRKRAAELERQKDLAGAFDIYSALAARGDAFSQCKLGMYYYNGTGIGKSFTDAAHWFGKAAAQGDMYGQYNLGCCYNTGSGVSRSYEKAAELFEKAAAQGHAQACNVIGLWYGIPRGTEYSPEKSVKWLERAAELGVADAMYSLGRVYDDGDGVVVDFKRAAEWFERAAKNGKAGAAKEAAAARAKYRAAQEESPEVPALTVDEAADALGDDDEAEEALRWYAEHGVAEAQYKLAVATLVYGSTDIPEEEAAGYCTQAAAQGHRAA